MLHQLSDEFWAMANGGPSKRAGLIQSVQISESDSLCLLLGVLLLLVSILLSGISSNDTNKISSLPFPLSWFEASVLSALSIGRELPWNRSSSRSATWLPCSLCVPGVDSILAVSHFLAKWRNWLVTLDLLAVLI